MSKSSVSIIIPAFQEEKRIAHTIESLSSYLEIAYPGTELIVVCDGCTDNTAKVAKESFHSSQCLLKIIELPQNVGKGAATKAGIEQAIGEYIIYTDADLSFAPATLAEFLPKLEEGADIAIAQRKRTTSYTDTGRRLLARVSRFLVGNFILPGIRDSQAGYKAFSSKVAKELFSKLITKRFLFDLEILIMAKRRHYKIEKVYVDWEDKPGSTVRFYVDTLRSFRDLSIIITSALMGYYD